MSRSALLLAFVVATGCGGGDVSAVPRQSTSAMSASASPTSATVPTAATAMRPILGEPSQVVATIDVGGQPCGIAEAGGWVWVSDASEGVISRVDAKTNTVVGRFPVDSTPCEMVPGFGSLWVATQSGFLDRVDPRTGRVLARIPVGQASYEPVIAFGSVWVTNRSSGTVSRVDPRTSTVAVTIETPGIKPGGIVEHGGRLWIGNDTAGARDVVRLDPRTGGQDVFPAGRRPNFVTSAGGAIWTADRDDGTVSRLDPATGRVLGTALVGVRPVNLTTLPAKRPEVWVPDDQGSLVTRIDATSGEVIERLLGGRGPAVATAIAGDVWVSNFEDGTVTRFRPGARG